MTWPETRHRPVESGPGRCPGAGIRPRYSGPPGQKLRPSVVRDQAAGTLPAGEKSGAVSTLGRNPDAGGHHLSSGAGIRQAADVRNLSITLNSLSVFLAFTICPPVLNSRVRAARQTRQG